MTRLIQISTDEVYGPIAEGRFEETAAIAPSNPYAATKAGADALVMSYRTTFGLPCTIARLSNVYGTWQHPQKAIPTFIRHGLSDTPLPVFGDGQHKRAWVSVEDVCDGLLLLAEKGAEGEIYHLAGLTETTNLDLATMVLEHLGKATNLIRFVPDADARPGHDRRYALAIEKAEKLGWRPKLSIAKYLPYVIDWYSRNRGWLD